MAGGDVNNERVELLENSFKQLEETVQKSLQQITQSIATLTTHDNEDQPQCGDPRRMNMRHRNGRPERQRMQQLNYGGEDSDVENDYEDECVLVTGVLLILITATCKRCSDFPWFNESEGRCSILVENLQLTRERQGKLPITSWERMERELRRRFLAPNHDQILFNLLQNCLQGKRSVEVYTAEFHRLSSRNDLSETESQQVTRYINGLSPEIQDRISLVPVYTLDDAYNLAIRAENQLAKKNRPPVFSSNRTSNWSTQSTFKPESSQSGSKSDVLDKKKQVVNTSTAISKPTNPYERPIVGKCFKCGLPGHRSSDCRATGGRQSLVSFVVSC
ncbi:hypothetical protein CTI12_AA608120 [Artemisia annua]|uniref:CCHC-type domain-containing protein n=1 Tax=Artemisia annua TaxID=35608 RepID=A0A2U1KFN3_ARTAN|nr:hypothetical protein CTI12_AA608120 [Artemisia annua]